MCRKSLIQRNNKRIKAVKKYENVRKKLKNMIKNKNISDEERNSLNIQLWSLPKNASPTRIRNRCLVTGRARGYFRKFGMSRIVFREKASYGWIPGIVKSSNH